ncbi:four helix bundle protein [Undibacterium sp. Ji22W]|uniref:four helix bundle protein n=1 Tax=Undibacterium sp. Ji22W TaxID=3413038 RepID=UPI003BF1F9B0
MAIHTDLPIYKSAYELLMAVSALVKNFPRSVKGSMGEPIQNVCVRIALLVAKANASRDKVPHLDELLELVMEVELMIRLAKDMKFISIAQYANVVLLTNTVGKQANGWRKASQTPAAI